MSKQIFSFFFNPKKVGGSVVIIEATKKTFKSSTTFQILQKNYSLKCGQKVPTRISILLIADQASTTNIHNVLKSSKIVQCEMRIWIDPKATNRLILGFWAKT